MTDYGRPLSFGYFLNPTAEASDETIAAAQLADELGLDLIGIQDHPYQPRFLDTWTFLAYLAANTRRIRFFPDVATLALRSPGMLAKAVTSLDRLSGGRVELGLGIGSFPKGIAAIGGAPLPPGPAIEALEEGIAVIRAMWSGDARASIEGRFFHFGPGVSGPVPAHPIQIWLGAYKPRILGLTGRLANGWVPTLGYANPNDLPGMHEIIDQAATRAGRDPADIARIYNVQGQITDGPVSGVLNGPVDHWVETLATLSVDFGMDAFVFGPSGSPAPQLRRYVEDVVPAVREIVERTRAARGTPLRAGVVG